MRRVFADTSFYQAIFNKRDLWHETATRVIRDLRARILTSEYVLVELGALMARGEARPLYVAFVRHLRADRETELISASSDLFNAGLALFGARQDKEWSLTDCISFALMRAQGIQEALTADRHFEQAGFAPLLQR